MKKSTRVLAILLAMMMILSSVPVAFADEDKTAYPDAPYWGDLNGDQKVNFSDIVRLNNIRVGKIQGTPEQLCFGDVNLDGELSGIYDESVGVQEDREDNMFKDILQINKYRLGKISSLPAESLAKITFNEPTKLSYKKGESFNKSGMSVVVQNKNNSSVKYTFTDNYITVTGFDSSTTGTKRLTATFRGLTWSFNVTVSPITHTVTYNYSYNGGASASITSATVAEGAAIDLTPTAYKNGWTFVGWNTSSSATTGLSSKTMGTSNVTLYAIYKKTLTGTFVDYSGTSKTTRTASTTIYNNATNGTVTAPTQNTYTGWTKRGWTTSTAADASPNTNSTFTISSDTTYYGLYQRTLTLSYDAKGGSPTPSSQTGTQYVNSYNISNTKDPSFTLASAPTKSGSTFSGWAKGSTTGTKFNPGNSVSISSNTTMYATWNEKNHTVTYNYSYNGGSSVTKTSATVAEGAAIDLSPTATKSGWTFVGWNTNANATTKLSSLNMGTSNVTLYAIFKKTLTGTFIDYSGTAQKTTTKTTTIWNRDTSGTVTAPTQNTYTGWTKRGWTTGTAADASTTTNYTLTADTAEKIFYGTYYRTLTLSYNANGGSPTPSSQTITQYVNSYNINNIKNPSVTLANAINKTGFTFDKWAQGSTSGKKYSAGSSFTISENTTMYATWKVENIYNLGEETYSFPNFHGEYIDQYGRVLANQCCDPNCKEGGHCFGMSITSAGYYLGELNKSVIGSSNDKALFTFSFTDAVKKPIHYYHVRQGKAVVNGATVAGGTRYKTDSWDTVGDWNAVVDKVKAHSYDNKGMFQIGLRKYKGKDSKGKEIIGGHAVNFLYYEKVDGQDRIYVYDNNQPGKETYLYLSGGKICQEPVTTYAQCECIALRDVKKYYENLVNFDETRVCYGNGDDFSVNGIEPYYMDADGGSPVIFELPRNKNEVTIYPNKDYASVRYLNKTFSFEEVDGDTYAKMTLASAHTPGFVGGVDDYSGVTFTIYNAPNDSSTPDTSTQSASQPAQSSGGCAYCGGSHTGIFGFFIGIFHSILAMLGLHK